MPGDALANHVPQPLIRSAGSCAQQNVARILAQDSVALVPRKLLYDRARNRAVRIADLIGKVGAEQHPFCSHEIDKEAQRRSACHHRVIVELAQILAGRFADVGATGRVRLVLGSVIGEIEASCEEKEAFRPRATAPVAARDGAPSRRRK